MGYAIAKASKEYGAKVTLISGPVSIPSISGITTININSADEMNDKKTSELSVSNTHLTLPTKRIV